MREETKTMNQTIFYDDNDDNSNNSDEEEHSGRRRGWRLCRGVVEELTSDVDNK